jgi:hypothetical protein
MYRRSLLKLIGSFAGSLLCGSALSTHRSKGPPGVRFFVAGARFHPTHSGVVVGDHVTILAGTFRGTRCYEVLFGQSRMGYVPRDSIGRLPDRPKMHGLVTVVNAHALPWKRFEITVPADFCHRLPNSPASRIATNSSGYHRPRRKPSSNRPHFR